MTNFYINPDNDHNQQNNNAYYNQFTSIRPTGLIPDNRPNIKYQEDISSDKGIVKNASPAPTHHSSDFMDFVALAIGNKENNGYYPIFNNGSKIDYGNINRLSFFINDYINNFINSAINLIFGSSTLDLDPNQLANCMAEFDGLVEQNFQENLANITNEDVLNTAFEVLYDPNKDLLKFIGSDAYYGENNE